MSYSRYIIEVEITKQKEIEKREWERDEYQYTTKGEGFMKKKVMIPKLILIPFRLSFPSISVDILRVHGLAIYVVQQFDEFWSQKYEVRNVRWI